MTQHEQGHVSPKPTLDVGVVAAFNEQTAPSGGEWVEDDIVGEVIEDRGSQITFSALGQRAPAEQKYRRDPDGRRKESTRRMVAALRPDLEVRPGGTTSIDVTRHGIDKAYGMRKLMEVLDVSSRDIVYFGDQLEVGGNDYAVKSTGIETIAVRDPFDAELALVTLLGVLT